MAKTGLLTKSRNVLTVSKANLLRKATAPAPLPDPLASVDYTGDLAEDGARELSALDKAFKENAKDEKRKHQKVIDTEYWVALCFESREQKEAFLQAVNLFAQGDKYLDGRLFAKRCNIALPDEAPPHRERGIDPKLAEIAL